MSLGHKSQFAVETEQDRLLREIEFPFSQTFYPYGYAVEFRTNAKEVLEAAGESLGEFRQVSPEPPMIVQVGIAGDEDGKLPPNPTFRAVQHLLMTTGDAEHFAVADFAAGFACCWVTPRIFRDVIALRHFYLESMGYCLVSERHLAGIHGACVSYNGSGILLCGPSQAGKSSLAYACARSGFTYIADDGTFLIREATDRMVTGNCYSIRFRPSASELFPELSEFVAKRRANGKLAMDVPTRRLALSGTAPRCRVDHVVFLNRQKGASTVLRPYSKTEAEKEMNLSFCFGRTSSIEAQRQAAKRVLELDVVEMVYSDPESAVECLKSLAT